MSQRQIPLRVAAMLAATAGALAPVAELLAKRRRPRRNANDDDDDADDLIRRRLRRRRNDDDDDDDDKVTGFLRARQRRKAREDANDEDDQGGETAAVNSRQSIVEDLGIAEIVDERIDNALFGGGGGGDEPNIVVSEDGDSLVVLTRDIEFAADAEGMEVETSGISYTSGAGGGVLDDFES